MARPLRIEFPGAVYHLTSRGNARQPVFADAQDRNAFLDALAEVVARFGWRCHAYCLMGNHYHLLVETPEANLARGMRQVNGVYTQRFNRRHQQSGHLFQGRYKAILVDRDAYLLELCRYVVLNPVRSGLVRSAGQYAWSSYRATVGRVVPPAFLAVDWVLGQFAEDREEAQERYKRFVRDGLRAPSPWEALKGQVLLGDDDFVEKLRPLLADAAAQTEVPKRQRRLARPPVAKVLAGAADAPRDERNRRIAAAYLDHDFTLTEIARHLGLHYTTISKVVRAAQNTRARQGKT